MRYLIALALSVLACAQTQQPQIENATVQAGALSGSLTSALSAMGPGPFWAAWQEPIIPGRRGDMCWSNGNNDNEHAAGAPVRLEGPSALLVLVRIENSAVDQLRIASPDCRFDGGGLPFHWITSVPVSESVAWLKTQLGDRNPDRALLVIALHSGPAAEQALDEFTSPTQSEKIRERAAFWLGNSRGAHGVQTLQRMLINDPSLKVREQVVFALSQSKEPAALATVIDTARNDKSPQIRGKALFWLGQKAGKQVTDVIMNAVNTDPERSVKEQALQALRQLPNAQGVPLLIDIAKNNPDAAIRKKAMFWLGESKDQRAVDFFAQVLK